MDNVFVCYDCEWFALRDNYPNGWCHKWKRKFDAETIICSEFVLDQNR